MGDLRTIFEKIERVEVREELALLFISKFRYADVNRSTDEIVEKFISSEYFAQRLTIGSFGAAETSVTYSLGPFNFENITINDFQKLDKESLKIFLIDYGNEPSWGDDRDSFIKLLNYFLEFSESLSNKRFYLINMDSIDKTSRKLEAHWFIYTFFILIISVDSYQNSITMMEWFYD